MRRLVDDVRTRQTEQLTLNTTPSPAQAGIAPEAESLSLAHRLLGNAAWAMDMASPGGPGALMAADWALQSVGVQSDLGGNQAMLRVMRHASGLTPRQLDAAQIIETATGSPLPAAVRARMEQAFGHDFGHVRIHTDGRAALAADGMDAHAVTVGPHIFFNRGEYSPGSRTGDQLLLHELTHVVQHDEGRLPTGGGVSRPSDPAETEAYANEDRLLVALAAPAPAADGDLQDSSTALAETTPAAATATATADLGQAPALRQEGGDEDAAASGDTEKANVDIPVDEIVARSIRPLQQTDAVAATILEQRALLEAQGQEPLPETLPAELISSQPGPEGASESPIGLSLESPQTLGPIALAAMTFSPGEITATTSIAVPEVQDAWGRYSAAATRTLESLTTAGGQLATSITDAITGASEQLTERSAQLQRDLTARLATASGSIDTYQAEAHTALQAKRDTRKAALKTEKDTVVGLLATAVETNRKAITDKTTALSGALRQLGIDHATAVTREAGRLSAEATALGEQQRAFYASESNWAGLDNDYDAELAADVGLYAVNTARASAQEIAGAATDVITDLQEDGDELATDLSENGTDYAESYDEKVQEIRDWYDDDLPNAEQRLDAEYEGAKGKIDDAAGDLKDDLTRMGTTLSGELDRGIGEINGQLQLAGTMAQEAVRLAIEDGMAAIQAQVGEVEIWLSGADPSHWPALVEVLDQMTAELDAEVPALVEQIRGVAAEILGAIAQGGTDGVSAMDGLWTQIDGRIASFEADAQCTLVTDVVNAIDEEVLAKKVQNEREGWDEQRTLHEQDLQTASTGFTTELQKEHDEGKANLDEKKTEVFTEMASPLSSLRTDLAEDCRFMAEHPWRARAWEFLKGVGRALLNFVKVLGIIVLVVVVIALIVIAVLGFEVFLAIAAAIAAFVATYSAIIGTIALILTVISIALAAIPMIMDFIGYLNGTVSSFELAGSSGEFTGTLLTEFLTDFGIGQLTKAGKLASAADAPSDLAQSLRGLESVDETITGAANFGEEVAAVTNAAGKVDEFADVPAQGAQVAKTIDEFTDTAKTIENTTNATEDVVTTTNAADNVVTTTNAADGAVDAAKTADNFDGNLRADSPLYQQGRRFDPASSRWVKPDDLSQWGSYIAARQGGYAGKFTDFRTASSGGKVFDTNLGRFVDPPAVNLGAADNVVTTTNTADNAVTTANTADNAVDTAKTADNLDGNLHADSPLYQQGRRFDPASSRWVKPDDLSQWGSYIAARQGGYAGKFTDFRTASRGGKVFDTNLGRFVDPPATGLGAADNVVTTTNAADNVVTPVNTADNVVTPVNAADNTVTTTNAADNAVDTANAADNVAPQSTPAVQPGGYQYKDLEGRWAGVQASWDVMKGVLASLWLDLNNGAPVNDLGGLWGLYQSLTAEDTAEQPPASGQ